MLLLRCLGGRGRLGSFRLALRLRPHTIRGVRRAFPCLFDAGLPICSGLLGFLEADGPPHAALVPACILARDGRPPLEQRRTSGGKGTMAGSKPSSELSETIHATECDTLCASRGGRISLEHEPRRPLAPRRSRRRECCAKMVGFCSSTGGTHQKGALLLRTADHQIAGEARRRPATATKRRVLRGPPLLPRRIASCGGWRGDARTTASRATGRLAVGFDEVPAPGTPSKSCIRVHQRDR